MIEDYIVIWGSGNSLGKAEVQLVEQVKTLCSSGFKLQGGVNVVIDIDNTILMFQTLIKEKQEN